MGNFVKKYHGDSFGHMYPAARAYRPEVFEYHMNKVLTACPEVDGYLKKYHSLMWARSKFNSEIKCDYINNNLAECFNSWIREIKDLPVDELADTIREKVMKLFDTRRKIGSKLHSRMLPAVVQQIRNRSRGLGNLKVGRSGNGKCEVRDTNNDNLRHVVYMDKHECTCLEWQHTGKPCEHAIKFFSEKRNPIIELYMHEYYSVQKFRAAYEAEIEPLTDRSQWPKVNLDFPLHPPLPRRSSGRPKKSRFKGCLENGGTSSTGKKAKKAAQTDEKNSHMGSKNRCKKCHELGHRQANCPTNGVKKRKRKSRSRTVVSLEAALTIEGPSDEVVVHATPNATKASTTEIVIPPSLQNSPGPVTRRQLALALADEPSQPPELNVASPHKLAKKPAKKLTPRKKQKN